MRAIPLIALAALTAAACSFSAGAQDEGGAPSSGSGDSRTYSVADFHSVSLAGSPDVVVRVGPATSVRAQGPSEALDRLEFSVERGELRIRPRRGIPSWGDMGKVTVQISTPRLDAAAVAGSGNMRVDTVRSDKFTGSISGSGDLQVDALDARDMNLSVAGSGTIRVAGNTVRQTISIAGSGDVEAGGLHGRDASVSIAGSGNVRAHATQAARISIMGSGDVELGGGAECTVRRMGSGSVRCTA